MELGLKSREEIPERRFTPQEMMDYYRQLDKTPESSKLRGFTSSAEKTQKSKKTAKKKKRK
ncbi:MAG: hypothetical protein HC769_18795 [Cyanobacteria bacterium CRU_2_1]|nr:hypothetical protein [Cyanobacteria bacterium RU_5_0]NJR60690.1 hypothetical protein [Cyanobacteria bacterium CRU_2_1]